MKQVLLIELNEVNFDFLRHYAESGDLPHLAKLIEQHPVVNTVSEQKYEDIEPWIQWVSAHTGLTLAQHKVFRLGDIVDTDYEQIWEHLERKFGLRVGAISPMNAKNRTSRAAFFVPDPWTPTHVTSNVLIRRLYGAVRQAVNDNAESRVSPMSLFWLLAGAAAVTPFRNYYQYLTWIRRVSGRPWIKALVLDQLLADLFIQQVRRHQPGFASLFLNAGAHIQHHYMFNSAAYCGEESNPEWYASLDEDPVLDVYRLYDSIVGQIQTRFPETRLLIATGLHQDPHPELTYYWRLRDHDAFLKKVGVPFARVEPRMSRDFMVFCKDKDEADTAAQKLRSAKAADGVPLFSVDNRGNDLFVMLTYPRPVDQSLRYVVNGVEYSDLEDDVVFVAIKNGQHNGIGYLLDTGVYGEQNMAPMKLPDLFNYVGRIFEDTRTPGLGV